MIATTGHVKYLLNLIFFLLYSNKRTKHISCKYSLQSNCVVIFIIFIFLPKFQIQCRNWILYISNFWVFKKTEAAIISSIYSFNAIFCWKINCTYYEIWLVFFKQLWSQFFYRYIIYDRFYFIGTCLKQVFSSIAKQNITITKLKQIKLRKTIIEPTTKTKEKNQIESKFNKCSCFLLYSLHFFNRNWNYFINLIIILGLLFEFSQFSANKTNITFFTFIIILFSSKYTYKFHLIIFF